MLADGLQRVVLKLAPLIRVLVDCLQKGRTGDLQGEDQGLRTHSARALVLGAQDHQVPKAAARLILATAVLFDQERAAAHQEHLPVVLVGLDAKRLPRHVAAYLRTGTKVLHEAQGDLPEDIRGGHQVLHRALIWQDLRGKRRRPPVVVSLKSIRQILLADLHNCDEGAHYLCDGARSSSNSKDGVRYRENRAGRAGDYLFHLLVMLVLQTAGAVLQHVDTVLRPVRVSHGLPDGAHVALAMGGNLLSEARIRALENLETVDDLVANRQLHHEKVASLLEAGCNAAQRAGEALQHLRHRLRRQPQDLCKVHGAHAGRPRQGCTNQSHIADDRGGAKLADRHATWPIAIGNSFFHHCKAFLDEDQVFIIVTLSDENLPSRDFHLLRILSDGPHHLWRHPREGVAAARDQRPPAVRQHLALLPEDSQ
mmetsp:Transcript_20935/g.49706  ORF Transcript_20935/g.49706 Transcript_20935/m.49706 type:complete len:425 (-) Transcript_20935:152-1426(-)